MAVKHDKYIIAVDFDGTLCVDEYPRIGKIKKRTVRKLLKRIKYLKHKNIAAEVILVLWTCRGGNELQEAIDFCRTQIKELEFKYINANPENIYGDDTRKLYAHEYWDDRARRIK